MILKFADLFYHKSVMDHQLRYKYEQYQANSEESFTGLGIEKSSSQTWFNHASDQPASSKKGTYDDSLLYVVILHLDVDV